MAPWRGANERLVVDLNDSLKYASDSAEIHRKINLNMEVASREWRPRGAPMND